MEKKFNLTLQGKAVEIMETIAMELGTPVNKTWLMDYIIQYHVKDIVNTNKEKIFNFCYERYYGYRVQKLIDENKLLRSELEKSQRKYDF